MSLKHGVLQGRGSPNLNTKTLSPMTGFRIYYNTYNQSIQSLGVALVGSTDENSQIKRNFSKSPNMNTCISPLKVCPTITMHQMGNLDPVLN